MTHLLVDLIHELREVRAKLEYHGFAPAEGQSLAAAVDSALSKLIHEKALAEAQVERARKVIAPFALIAELDAKGKDGLESVHPTVAAGRLHDARRFLDELRSTDGDSK